MSANKKTVSITLNPTVHKKARKYYGFLGYRSFSDLVEDLLKHWLYEKVEPLKPIMKGK